MLSTRGQEFLEALQLGCTDRGGYQQGRVVDLRQASHKTLYLIGDVHAKAGRIADIFKHADLYPQLQGEQAVVVFLGDLFHREDDARAGEMESSIETLGIVMDLKIRFPQSIYMLLGNHEFTRSETCKRGYFQGYLFRLALESQGLDLCYDRFVEVSPLVVIHPQCVGVHAAPAISVQSLDELKILDVADVHPFELPRAVMELTYYRHVNWSPCGGKVYNDYHVEDFLNLCGVPQGSLITGHTPICRDTCWHWQMGPRNSVIFAAGREVGYLRADALGFRFIRVGRSLVTDDDTLVVDRTPLNWELPSGVSLEQEGGHTRVRIDDPSAPVDLLPDVCYRLDYTRAPIRIGLPGCDDLWLRHYRHLSASSQDYYAHGYYLAGNEMRQEILKLKRDQAIILGGTGLCHNVRFAWGPDELMILRQGEDGQFEFRALVEGVQVS
ncbi:metallophosphoesterase [bacterium]|nr:metallophosphoesterase [bacterium]